MLVPRARAKVSLRLTPGDDGTRAQLALVDHLRANVPWGAELVVTADCVGEPFALTTAGAVYDIARSAFADAYGNGPVEMGLGGSVPFIGEFARAYPSATVLMTGVGDPQSRWHGIDESVDLAMWETACLAEMLLLSRLAP